MLTGLQKSTENSKFLLMFGLLLLIDLGIGVAKGRII